MRERMAKGGAKGKGGWGHVEVDSGGAGGIG